MLYPIEEKAMYDEPYIVLINSFREDLRLAPAWLFVGYRFNDPFLLRVIEYCSDTSKRIGIIHPEAEGIIRSRLGNVHGQKKAFPRRFANDDTLLREISTWLKPPRSIA